MPGRPPQPTRAETDRRSSTPSASDRGVSEVVSFILTFSMITMMVGILYTAGFVSMEQLQTGNQMQNAEGVFFAMADSFTELQEGQAPKRAGSLDLDVGASVGVTNESTIEVEVYNETDRVFDRTLRTRSLDYRLDDRVVTYENGAVFRTNKDDTGMVRAPDGIFCSPGTNAAMVSVVTLVDLEGSSVASGTVTVTGIQQSGRLLYPTDRNRSGSLENVTVNVSSTNGAAWDRYLSDETDWDYDGGDDVHVCDDQVFVRHTVIEIRTNS